MQQPLERSRVHGGSFPHPADCRQCHYEHRCNICGNSKGYGSKALLHHGLGRCAPRTGTCLVCAGAAEYERRANANAAVWTAHLATSERVSCQDREDAWNACDVAKGWTRELAELRSECPNHSRQEVMSWPAARAALGEAV